MAQFPVSLCVLLVGLLTIVVIEARYLPTRPDEADIDPEKLQQILEALRENHVAAEETKDLASDSLKHDVDEKAPMIGSPAVSVPMIGSPAVSEEDMELPEQKRVSYQFICLDRFRRPKICSKKYRRRR